MEERVAAVKEGLGDSIGLGVEINVKAAKKYLSDEDENFFD